MMELGALVCTPRSPSCGTCPLKRGCAANRNGSVDRIPPPRNPPGRSSSIIMRGDSSQRAAAHGAAGTRASGPACGKCRRWSRGAEARAVAGASTLRLPLSDIERLGSFTHELSHRRIHVHVFRGAAAPGVPVGAILAPPDGHRQAARQQCGSGCSSSIEECPVRAPASPSSPEPPSGSALSVSADSSASG